jgi:Putative polyhydroxyalkanoic acid system protein (PHA_gran_rgn)
MMNCYADIDVIPSTSEYSRCYLFAIQQSVRKSLVPDPIVVTISHQLGREEAKRRLDNGLGYIRDQLAAFVSSTEYGWTGYRLDFGLTAMRQSIVGRIDVEKCLVRVELGLPLLLSLLSTRIINRIRREGLLLLDKPSG